MHISFEWDDKKNKLNISKHGVSFETARKAFFDYHRVIAKDLAHSNLEKRYYCFGKVDGEVVTVRFTYRRNRLRIIGAGYWRKGKRIYEQKNKIYK